MENNTYNEENEINSQVQELADIIPPSGILANSATLECEEIIDDEETEEGEHFKVRTKF